MNIVLHFMNDISKSTGRIQNIPVDSADGHQFLDDILINGSPLRVDLIKKPFFIFGFSPAKIEKQICNNRNNHPANADERGNDNRVFKYGSLPPSVCLVCGNSIISREEAFYNRPDIGETA
jgi:hypothetical protein